MNLTASRLTLHSARVLLCLAPALALSGSASCASSSIHGVVQAPAATRVPEDLFEVVKIVDGDTIHIMRGGQKEKLRLLSVDTEEKFTPGQRNSGSKPQTIYGEETRLWTIDFFEQFRAEDGKLRVGLSFPDGAEARDVYGRLLCHVLTSDGTDFNLLLVQLGKSPYFNKYGNSRICHQDFVSAQIAARRNRLGIWNVRTNQTATEDQPVATRPYDQLLPWWQCRAEAIDDFRTLSERDPKAVLAAEDPDALAVALAGAKEVLVFGSVDRFFEEDDGSRTVLLRTSDKQRALRVSIPKESRQAFEGFDLDGLRDEYRQNYIYVRGVIVEGPRGFGMLTDSSKRWKRAGPEPK
ncbi:MAG: endonuclease YncB(thermonuclease family) [Candidatus Paceibacteria bacterium]|jgi:endonuclease YncB( thermonuclease family)